MNGVCCKRLLDSTEEVFEKVTSLIENKFETLSRGRNRLLSQITGVVDIFKSLFECMDVVFAKLRILDPSMKPKKVLKVEVKAEKRRKVIQRLFDSSSENYNCSS